MPMTVGEARALLSQYPNDLPLMREYDSRVFDDLEFKVLTLVPYDNPHCDDVYDIVSAPTADSWTVLVAC
jgi:hypothetical protein